MEFLGAFVLFIRFGLLCFGGGNSLVPLYLDEFVDCPNPWLTPEEFGNLTAIAQITPGPIGVNTATFLGFRNFGGAWGALGATLGLLTPSFLMMTFIATHISRIERNRFLNALMRGVAPATVALMFVAVLIYGGMSLWDAAALRDESRLILQPFAFVVCAAAAWAICANKMKITTVILASAVAGALFWGLTS
ncbi:MAG: chromate transporter [Kiritimatiellaeota bacterium]|nr:chromate transporter [Kiritimatiellota bacterium]